MRIINTVKNSRFCLAILAFCILHLLCGCSQADELEQAQGYLRQSQDYYRRAIGLYKDLIKRGKDLDRLYLELGKVYYNHGEFKEAVEAFRKSGQPEAKKFLAISYYRLANFTDALEIFNSQEIADEEYLYYQGLTCEKLNLFDQALEAYKKIKNETFKEKAKARIDVIEKQVSVLHIKDIDPKTYKILANAPQSSQYPQAGALILSCDERIEVSSEGTQVSYLHYIIKILNERGKEDFSETHVDYDSTFEKMELEYARTIKPDGSVTEVGSRHIRDVSRYLNFPLYSNARVYIISFPEITEGAVIEYKLKIYNNHLINKKDFVLGYTVQSGEPIIAANFSITLPKKLPLHIKIINDRYNDFGANLNPKTEEHNGNLIYAWQFKNIPQIIPESNMPPNVQINPTLLVSTFNSWQDIYDWWWQLAKDKLKADEAIKKKVRELTRDTVSQEQKLRAIYNFCAQKIRYVAVEYGKAGYEPHNAEDIFRNKYGDCKDKAILLVTMLKEEGFLAWPVLIATKEYYNLNEDFPSVLFNHCIVAVSLKDKIVFLDATAQTCSFMDLPPDDQARKVLIFKEDGFKIQDTPMYPASHNLVKQELKLKINDDESISAEKSIFSFGFYDQAQRYWLLYTQPELIQEMLKEKIQVVSIGAKLKGYTIENLDNLNLPVVLRYSFQGPEYFTLAGNLRIMPQLTLLDTSLVAKDKRRYPLDFGVLDTKETIFEIEIPGNLVVKYLPDSVTEDSSWLKLMVEYKRRNNKIYFRQEAQIKKNTVSQAEYSDFKKFFEGLARKIKQRIVVERIRQQ
jgi:tetratricopeptide (TPR) repeat protein